MYILNSLMFRLHLNVCFNCEGTIQWSDVYLGGKKMPGGDFRPAKPDNENELVCKMIACLNAQWGWKRMKNYNAKQWRISTQDYSDACLRLTEKVPTLHWSLFSRAVCALRITEQCELKYTPRNMISRALWCYVSCYQDLAKAEDVQWAMQYHHRKANERRKFELDERCEDYARLKAAAIEETVTDAAEDRSYIESVWDKRRADRRGRGGAKRKDGERGRSKS